MNKNILIENADEIKNMDPSQDFEITINLKQKTNGVGSEQICSPNEEEKRCKTEITQ